MRKAMVALGLAAVTLTACTEGEVYSLPASRVESRLRSMAMPSELGFGSNGGSYASVERASSRGVTWRIADRGATFGWLEAKFDPVDLEHTRVAVDFHVDSSAGPGTAGQQKLMSAVGKAVLAEAIDAELEGRAYNKGRAQTQVAIYAIAHRDELRNFQFDERWAREDYSSERVAATVGARDPQLAVEMRQEDTERRMEAASAPSLNLDPPSSRY